VFTLRTFDDLHAIQNALENKNRVLVIGGGLLGLEAAYGLMGLGKQVHVVEALPYLLPRQLDAYMSEKIRIQLQEMGMGFTFGIPCAQIESAPGAVPGNRHASVTGMRLKDGSFLEADAILFSAGVRPNTALAQGSPLAVNRGIVVDEHMRTNLPEVYAAGDVAELDGMLYGLWSPALEQGKVAGQNMAGGSARYAPTELAATLSIGRVKLFSAGEINNTDAFIPHEEDTLLHRLYVRDGRVAGVVLTGDLSLSMKAKNLVRQRTDLPHPDALQVRFHDLFR
jgi:nitrite reductase (NADH) large subunit